mmetsp:Transcript_18534/g.47395  ORF Transcript_18534/g.47395 Transcript_18534/m.47395 type:complete len:194 (-) Transcript_18534:215-796(-)
MGTDMYHFMSRLSSSTPRIEFGIAMLKVVRLLTSALGGEGYLSFMGNEFGHPDWIDFPREGNNFSFEKARRRWDLVDDPLLRFRWLNDFDRAMHEAAEAFGWMHAPHGHVVCADEEVQLLVFERGGLLFVANLHPTATVQEYTVRLSAHYSNLVLSTDDAQWGGRSRTICLRLGAKRGDFVLAVPPCCMFVAN